MSKSFGAAVPSFLALFIFLIFTSPLHAKSIGADAPCKPCCGQSTHDVPSGRGPCPDIKGGSFISASSGVMGDSYPVVQTGGLEGAGLSLELFYASYNADGEKAMLATVMGIGWSHSYNIILFAQGRDIFKMSPGGLTTKYQRGGRAGTLSATRGHQQTITENPDGSIIINNKDGQSFTFRKITGNPLTILGAVPWMLTKVSDRNGNATVLTYQNGQLYQVTDAYGRVITFGYDSAKRINSITDPLGRITRLGYDGVNNLAFIQDSLLKKQLYGYNWLHQMTTRTDKNGVKWSYQYNGVGKPVGILDGYGKVVFSLTNTMGWATNTNELFLNSQRVYLPGITKKSDGNGAVWEYHYNLNGSITKRVVPDGCTTLYTYDPLTLNLATETDANGNTTSYEYDRNGNLLKETDAKGNQTLYEYESIYNNVIRITYPNGSVMTCEYDATGNRIVETRDVGGLDLVKQWNYDIHGNVVSETDHNGHTTTYGYDSYGNRISVTDPEGCVTRYEYDILGNRTAAIDGNGNRTTYSYDSLNRLILETDPLGYVTDYTYDGNGNRTGVKKQVTLTPATFQQTLFTYDLRNRLIQEIRISPTLSLVTKYAYDGNDNRITVTDSRGKVTTYQYDKQNRLTKVTDPLSNITETVCDCVGNKLLVIDANSHYTYFEYDQLNRLTAEIKKIGDTSPAPDGDDIVTRYFYDAGGSGGGGCGCGGPTPGSSNIAQIIDPEGKVTYFKFDRVDRKVKSIRKVGDTADVIDVDDWVETVEYDPANNVLKRTDANGNATTYTYYPDNRLKTQTNALAETTSVTYDDAGNVKTVTDPGGNVTTNNYSARNELTESADSVGLRVRYSYDGVGNRIGQTDGNRNITTYGYDLFSRLISTTDPMGQTSTYGYDLTGNVINTTDREGKVACYLYDDINRRTQTAQLMGGNNCVLLSANDIWSRTEYDPVGNVLRLLTAKKGSTPLQCAGASPPVDCEITKYQYNEVNRLTRETYPDAKFKQFAYDKSGNLKTRIDQKSQVTTYAYNDLYHLLSRTYPLSLDTFTYDTGGRMLTALRGGWPVTFTYDPANRVTLTTQNSKAVQYAYDIPNRRRTVTYPGGRVVIEQMDPRQRLVTISDGGSSSIAGYVYDLGNRVTTRAYRNGVQATYLYNPNNWITKLEHRKADTSLIAGFGYSYDKEGNKQYEEKQHLLNRSEAYRYDDIYRLIDYKVGELVGSTVPIPLTQTQYNLDKLGNWDSKVMDGLTQNRTHNVVNELTKIYTVDLSYDGNGNLADDQTYSFSYDEENRLAGVTRKSDSRLVGQYRYDALSRRIAKIVDADPAGTPVETRYFYDNARIVEEQNTAGVSLATYIYGNYIDEVLTMNRSGQAYYYHQNAIWSVAAITDSAANVVEQYSYDAYGFPIISDGAGNSVPMNIWNTPYSAIANPWMFTGRQLDEETSLYYYRARSYDSGKGKFLQRDPIGYVLNNNLYEFVKSRPSNFVDPLGLYSCPNDVNDERKLNADFVIVKLNAEYEVDLSFLKTNDTKQNCKVKWNTPSFDVDWNWDVEQTGGWSWFATSGSVSVSVWGKAWNDVFSAKLQYNLKFTTEYIFDIGLESGWEREIGLKYKFWRCDKTDGTAGCCEATLSKLNFNASYKIYPTRIVAALAGAAAFETAAAETMAFSRAFAESVPRGLRLAGAIAN